MHPEVGEHSSELVVQPPLGLLVAGRVADLDVAVAGERDPVLGERQVLGRQPEVDRVAGDVAQRPRRREPRLAGFSPRNIGACDLPTIWMLPIGYS